MVCQYEPGLIELKSLSGIQLLSRSLQLLYPNSPTEHVLTVACVVNAGFFQNDTSNIFQHYVVSMTSAECIPQCKAIGYGCYINVNRLSAFMLGCRKPICLLIRPLLSGPIWSQCMIGKWAIDTMVSGAGGRQSKALQWVPVTILLAFITYYTLLQYAGKESSQNHKVWQPLVTIILCVLGKILGDILFLQNL